MLDLPEILAQWGYLAIVIIVVLGNVGLPIPEETVLLWSGYLAWTGELSLPMVILAGLTGAIGGDNFGFRIGRRCGRSLLHRDHGFFGTAPAGLDRMERLVARYGVSAVFVARFVPGLRALAGPLAGVTNLPFARFFTANALGALIFVPIVVGLGYSSGPTVGAHVKRLRGSLRHGELLAVVGLLAAVIALVGWVRRRPRRPDDLS